MLKKNLQDRNECGHIAAQAVARVVNAQALDERHSPKVDWVSNNKKLIDAAKQGAPFRVRTKPAVCHNLEPEEIRHIACSLLDPGKEQAIAINDLSGFVLQFGESVYKACMEGAPPHVYAAVVNTSTMATSGA